MTLFKKLRSKMQVENWLVNHQWWSLIVSVVEWGITPPILWRRRNQGQSEIASAKEKHWSGLAWKKRDLNVLLGSLLFVPVPFENGRSKIIVSALSCISVEIGHVNHCSKFYFLPNFLSFLSWNYCSIFII